MLPAARYVEKFAVFDELRAGLLEREPHARLNAVLAYRLYPVEIADPCVIARLTADHHEVDPAVEVGKEIYLFEQRLAGDELVLYRRVEKERQALVGSFLVFAGTADRDVVVTVAPVVRQTVIKPQNAFGYYNEVEVGTAFYYAPRVAPPFVRRIEKKVGRKTGVNARSGLYLVTVAAYLPWKIEGLVALDLVRVLIDLSVDAEDVAVKATLAVLFAAVPGVPKPVHISFSCGFSCADSLSRP